MPEKDSWSARFTRSVAEEVQRHRKARGWSAQKLSNACADLGLDFPRSTLADLENGRRVQLGVTELLVLARALDIPPLLLLFPVGTEEEAEVLPGRARPVFRAAQWFTGEGPFPGPDDANTVTITDPANAGPARPLALYRAHDRAFEEEMQAMTRAKAAAARAAEADPGIAAVLAPAAEGLRLVAEEHWTEGERLREEAGALGIRPPGVIMGLRIPQADSTPGAQKPAEEKHP